MPITQPPTSYPDALDEVIDSYTSNTPATPSHYRHHNLLADVVNALQAKLGIGASTPVVGTFLRANTLGQSTWAPLTPDDISDVLGSSVETVEGAQAKADTVATAAAAALASHEADTSDVHGIVDTSVLETSASVLTHRLTEFAPPNAPLSLGDHRLIDVSLPTVDTDAATKAYVDTAGAGITWKNAVRAATTVAGTLASSFENGDTIDGVVLVTGDRILIKNQAAPAENGLYVVAASGAPARSTDADTGAELVAGTAVLVTSGTVNAGSQFRQSTTGTITLNTTALVWQQFGQGTVYSAGLGIVQTGNAFALDAPVTVARGGTGAASAPAALTALGAAASADLVTHMNALLSVHGIPDTALLALLDALNTFTVPQKGPFLDKGGAYFNAKAYSLVGDGVTSDRAALNTLAGIATPGEIYFPSGTYLIDSNLTIASTIQLSFGWNAKIAVPNGITVTINGPIKAEAAQIFLCTGTGKVVLTNRVHEAVAEWWGAIGDGITVDTVPWQACIDTTNAARIPVQMPPRTYVIDVSLLILSATGFVLRGSGAALAGGRYSQFLWKGDTVSPLLRLQDTSRSHFSDFSIRGSSAFPLHSGIWMENLTAGASVTPLRNLFVNVIVDGATPGAGLGRGFVHQAGTGMSDANADYDTYVGCHVTNYTYAGWLFNHSQSKAHVLLNCAAQANYASARVGVGCGIDWSAGGAPGGAEIGSLTGGSFTWIGGGISDALDGAFWLSANGDSCWIGGGFNIEKAARLIYGGANNNSTPNPSVMVDGGRYAPSSTLNADGYWIHWKLAGQMKVSNVRVEVASAAHVPKILHNPGASLGGHAMLSVDTCFIETGDHTQFIVQSGAGSRVVAKGNRYRDRTSGLYGDYPDQDYGYKSGTFTIPSGATAVAITHGLDTTPLAQNIALTPTNNPTNDPGHLWFDTITATQVTAHCRNDPGASGLTGVWQVRQ